MKGTFWKIRFGSKRIGKAILKSLIYFSFLLSFVLWKLFQILQMCPVQVINWIDKQAKSWINIFGWNDVGLNNGDMEEC